MILFRGPCLLLCGPYYTVTIVLYDIMHLLVIRKYLLHYCSYTDAIPDFEAAIKLDNTVACFHVCLGLTYLLYSKQYQRYIIFVCIIRT